MAAILQADRTAATGLHIPHLIVLLLLSTLQIATAFQSVPGSECESQCRDGRVDEDAVCLDAQFREDEGGERLQTCVSCLLNSTGVDTANNVTDVEWGLYNLRYTLSSCMFGVPQERVSISSPCQVTCAPLNASIGYRLTNDSSDADPSADFCTASRFDDTTINNCAFCYSLIPQQLFTANFLQALHILCRDPPDPGDPFFPDGPTIFNETLIAGPAPPSEDTNTNSGLQGSTLAIAIALPVVGGILIIGFGCWGCFIFTRRRRKRMAASGRMSRVHEQQAEGGSMYSPIEGKVMWGENEPAREMAQLSPHFAAVQAQGRQPSPRVAQRWSGHGLPSPGVYPPGTAIGEDGTPLRSSFQREDVGPGEDQLQDPNLHEQYFGIADGGEDHPGQAVSGLGLHHGNHSGGDGEAVQLGQPNPPPLNGRGVANGESSDDERGEWVR